MNEEEVNGVCSIKCYESTTQGVET